MVAFISVVLHCTSADQLIVESTFFCGFKCIILFKKACPAFSVRQSLSVIEITFLFLVLTPTYCTVP